MTDVHNKMAIPAGFEPATHSLEGCCSNPTELRDHGASGGTRTPTLSRQSLNLVRLPISPLRQFSDS